MIAARPVVGVVLGTLACCVLASPARAAPPPDFFGVVPQGPLEQRDFARMAEAEVGTLRFQLSWALANPEPGIFDWTASDALVGGAAATGIRPLPFLFETPRWVSAGDGRACEPNCGVQPPRREPALEAWRAFAEAAARRYGRGGDFWREHPEIEPLPVRVWQIWNEQNSPTFFAPKPSPRRYLEILGRARDAIVAVDRSARVILGGMFGSPRGGRGSVPAGDFLVRLYARGAASDFDGVASHPYAPTLSGVFAQIERLRTVMTRSGNGSAKLWITELGWASNGQASALNRGPAGQAKRLRQAFEQILADRRRLGIANVDWYSWRDQPPATDGLCSWCPGSGLVSSELDPKPAMAAFTAFTGGR